MLRPDMQDLIDQFVKFRIQYFALESKCRGMEEDYRLDIAEINRAHADQIMRMEEEIEILNSQLAAIEELHRDEVRNIENRYEREKSNFERTIDILKSKITELRTAFDKNIKLNTHPALNRLMSTKQSQRTKPVSSIFKWPSLEVESSKMSESKTISTQDAILKKKRKLYSIDEDSVVDITL